MEGRTSGKAGGLERTWKKKKKRGKWVSGLKGGRATAIGDMQPGRERSERKDGGSGRGGLSKLRRKGSRRV